MRADLCTFAKAMGNGYPISVLAGREDIMRRLGKGVVHGGTFTAHSVALAAAEKTLEILDETPALQTIAEYGTQPARRDESDSFAARHQAFLQRPPFDERPVLQRAAAAKLSRLGQQRLHLLRSARPRAARSGRAVRAGLARALVRLRGARRALPRRNARSDSRRRSIASWQGHRLRRRIARVKGAAKP